MESKKVYSGFLWKFFERCGAELIAFIVSLVLARLLQPEAYGTIALVSVFISIFSVFIESGMGTAIVQKKDADELDFSTLFYFNVVSCSFFYIVIFFLAPYIASFYSNSDLVPLIRVLGISLLVAGVKGIQQSYVYKYMEFKRFFWATLIGTLTSALVGIVMAYNGYGVWALIAQSLTNNIIDTIMLWVTVKWRPKWMFSFERLKTLFAFGWKMLCSSLLDTVYGELRALIIGKMYAPEDLAYYNRGQKLPNLVIKNINVSVDSVLLPALSAEQDKKERVKDMTRRAIKVSVFIIAPMMVGLAVCGTNIVTLLLTKKWLPAVPYMSIFCITYIFHPIHTANLNAIKALGRSDLFLILEIIKKIVGLIALFSTMWFGPMVMCYSLLFTSVISQIINSWPNKKLLNYSYIQQLKDIMPSILLSVAMGVVVYFVGMLSLPVIILLIMQVLVGASIYFLGAYIFKFESFTYMLNLLKSFLIKKKKVENNETN